MVKKIFLENVYKNFIGEGITSTVLQDITLTFDKKEFIAIIGPSGSGKSTLLSLIATLDKPTRGDIYFDELNTTNLKNSQLADIRFEEIGFIFQQYHLLSTLTSLENVMAPGFARKVSYNLKEKAKELLFQVGLQEKLNSLPSQLSGGQQQRVAIARALIQEPNWILADEPTGNLDSQNSQLVFEMIKNINKEKNIGVLFVTHDLELAKQADRVIEMKDGQIVLDTGDKRC